MKYCPHCGKELPKKDVSFCVFCGESLGVQTKHGQGSKRRKAIVASAAGAVLIAIAIGGVLALTSRNTDEPSTLETAAAPVISSTKTQTQTVSSVWWDSPGSILSKADVTKLKSAKLNIPILLPSQVPAGAKCAAVTVGSNEYLVGFYHSSGCSENTPNSDLVASTGGTTLGIWCDKNGQPTSANSNGQRVSVGTNPGTYGTGMSGHDLNWCFSGGEYFLTGYYPLDKAVEAAANMKTVSTQ